MTSTFKINDEITFSAMTPDGRIHGSGKIVAIFPGARSYWLHVLQPEGTIRMLFEATANIQIQEAQAA